MTGFYGMDVCLYDYIVLQVVRRCFAGRGRYGVLDRVGRVGWIVLGGSFPLRAASSKKILFF